MHLSPYITRLVKYFKIPYMPEMPLLTVYYTWCLVPPSTLTPVHFNVISASVCSGQFVTGEAVHPQEVNNSSWRWKDSDLQQSVF